MFDRKHFNEILVKYKRTFADDQWKNEKYKWEAVKCFQDNWNVNAEDFAAMLHNSLDKTSNLLTSLNNFPRGMIEGFSKKSPEEVRAMFIDLFDESNDVFTRIKTFKSTAASMLDKYGNGAAQHYQHENAVSTYLWLRYPDKYYIYKYGEIKSVAEELKSNFSFKKGSYSENIRNFYSFYDEICSELKKDTELVDLFKSELTESCYPDPELKTLTIDVGFYISRKYSENNGDTEEWFPADYKTGLSKTDWLNLLKDKNIFDKESLEILNRMKNYGGQATCKQLSVKYGNSVQFYKGGSVALAKRVSLKTGCQPFEDESEKNKWWPILYVGKKAGKNDDGVFIWKLRKELSEALSEFNSDRVSAPVKNPENCEKRNYWWLNANPKIWSFNSLSVGESQSYTFYNENGNKRRIFQNFLDAESGDILIGYESTPVKKVVAIAEITGKSEDKELVFKKIEGLSSPIDYETLKTYPELEKMEYLVSPQGSLFKLTEGEYNFIMDIIREDNPLEDKRTLESYTERDFLNEVYMTESRYKTLVSVLRNKKNLILQGAPGVGKTFAAKRLAYSIMGEKDDNRIEFVQFHQNYSYEDFMMGYKPAEEGFELKYGIFYNFCQKAANQPGKDFFFIIDEINRGNMSKIFGELLMLIEKDYRGTKVKLAYNGLNFSVPKNLYIIGMMNTADRSLAMIDYALRRRFSFFEMEPGFDSDGFVKYQKKLNNETFDRLVEKIKELNNRIESDKSLGRGFCIGHSYLCGADACTEEWLQTVVDFDLLPMLEEYWFDDQAELQRWSNVLHGVFQ